MTEENCIRTTRADCTNQSIFRIFEYKEELLRRYTSAATDRKHSASVASRMALDKCNYYYYYYYYYNKTP